MLIVHSASMSTSTFAARCNAGHILKCSDIMAAVKNRILKKFCMLKNEKSREKSISRPNTHLAQEAETVD